MEKNRNLLKKRETYLTQLKEEKEKNLLSAPEGTLRICDYGNRTQYYHRMNPADRFGTYMLSGKLIAAPNCKLKQTFWNQPLLKQSHCLLVIQHDI